MRRTIVFTGGGTAGHVTVNLAIIPYFQYQGWEVHYIGSQQGIERELISVMPDVHYHNISTGKLRRYMDWNNVKDPFRVLKGLWQTYRLLAQLRPHVIFSKGGFVSVPVIAGAWLHRIPSIIHESDLTPGLANRLCIPFATRLCTTFPETGDMIKSDKVVYLGTVIRKELFAGEAIRGLALCQFVRTKPVLLIMGGSLGSQRINQVIRNVLPQLTAKFQVLHICGKGNVKPELESRTYRQFEFVKNELADLLTSTDLVISRAGSNSIFEFLALKKPMLLIPLSSAASRGDQIANAESFRKRGFASVLAEEDCTDETLLAELDALWARKAEMIAAMDQEPRIDATPSLINLIEKIAK